MESWDEVSAFGLSLPGTELSTSYGKPAVKVNGKAFLYPGREVGSFAVASPLPEKELLIETDSETFWETDHYRGWPAVLIRYGRTDPDRVKRVIVRAWWDRLKKAQKSTAGARP